MKFSIFNFFKFFILCGCVISGYASSICTVSIDCSWPDSKKLKALPIPSPIKVKFKTSVTITETAYDENNDEALEIEHVHSQQICMQSLKEFRPLSSGANLKRESAYNFVASITSMLYGNGIPTDNPLIREATKDRVLQIAKGIQGDFFVNRAVVQKEGSPPRLHILGENFLKITPETVKKMREMGDLLTEENCLKIKQIAGNNPNVIAKLIVLELEREKFENVLELHAGNIKITADIIDAIKCRASALTTDEIDLFLHFSVRNRPVFVELLKMAPHRVQYFKNILAQSTMEHKEHRILLRKTADFVLQIAQGFAPSARLYASDVLAFSQKFLSRNKLSTYELIDFARVAIKRESWCALMLSYADHDTLHDLCDMDR